ncbi:hypothetical protein WOLCODRAFT_112667 [Wolfiporia cocos MD-104 SS10]|uniref:TM7S3/TM198-like domain-containing protein n=1 Tax=Wolfiporia cocos (strain MD-104) TaxID=742152 RepID=A0A2H3IV59_WOLCO|nr:hypothetical protein WOLCODRAFT_112667 [Wolfiporia cocos MD-104 SS10]
MFWPCLLALVYLLSAVSAQSSTASASARRSSSAASSTTAASTSLSLTTSYVTTSTTIQSGGQSVPVSTVITSVYNVTVTANASTSASSTSSSTASASATPIALDTKIDPAFGVLGALLILTGLPSAFLGHKNRWTSFFLIGVYTFALVCFVLIVKFGILQAVNPPDKTVRGLFVLACGVAGIAGGGIAIFFWQATRYFVGAWGGFVVAMWVQCFRAGGLISPIGFRWILYICLAAVGFVLCTLPKIHYQILLLSTSFVGATAIILGIDCFTTGGLKEFYMWNLGFTDLFPKFTNNGIKFPISQTMEIELGLIGAVSLMGIAVQFQVLKVLQEKLKDIKAESKRRNEEAEARAALRFNDLDREKAEWDREHPTFSKDGRSGSGLSQAYLLKDGDDRSTPSPEHRRASGHTLVDTPRQRYQSGVSDFLAAPPPADEINRSVSRGLQSPGVLPVLDLGTDIEQDVPQDYIADPDDSKVPKGKKKAPTAAELEDLKRKQELLAEIQTLRKSIEVLKTDTPDPSSSSNSRHPSFTSRRTLSYDLDTLSPAAPQHLRPPRQADPRARIQSMEMSNLSYAEGGGSIGRPTSAPLRDDDWDSYVRDRKLLQPPSGVTPPIPTTPIAPTPRIPVSPAVEEALLQRQRRESALSMSHLTPEMPPTTPSAPRDYFAAPAPRDYFASPAPQKTSSSGSDEPAVVRTGLRHNRSQSQGGVPVTILPPRRATTSPTPQPEAVATPWTNPTRTFEELAERHREKIKQLQEPVTRAEKEQAELQEAKARWERAKAREKAEVAKRQAEKAAVYSSKETAKHKAEHGDSKRKSRTLEQGGSRPLSADVLAAVSGAGASSSKRMSKMKVEDWQKQQQDAGLADGQQGSRAKRQSAVPFPETQDRSANARDRRRMPRDSPS